MPEKKKVTKTPAKAKKVTGLPADLAEAKAKIEATPDTAEFRQARKYLIMYARAIQDILTARK